MLGHYGDITGPHTNPNQTRAQFGNEQIQGTGLDGWFSGTNASGQICCLFHVDTTQPFYLRWHVDPSSGVNAAKVWPASAPEPKTWQRWWLIGHTWSGTNWLRIQTFDNESTADFARFYIDQIDMWGSAP